MRHSGFQRRAPHIVSARDAVVVAKILPLKVSEPSRLCLVGFSGKWTRDEGQHAGHTRTGELLGATCVGGKGRTPAGTKAEVEAIWSRGNLQHCPVLR